MAIWCGETIDFRGGGHATFNHHELVKIGEHKVYGRVEFYMTLSWVVYIGYIYID